MSKRSLLSVEVWQWLFQHTGFPRHRLPAAAERLVMFAAAAEAENGESMSGETTIRQDGAMLASQRQLAQNRSHTHIKSNNRTKV